MYNRERGRCSRISVSSAVQRGFEVLRAHSSSRSIHCNNVYSKLTWILYPRLRESQVILTPSKRSLREYSDRVDKDILQVLRNCCA